MIRMAPRRGRGVANTDEGRANMTLDVLWRGLALAVGFASVWVFARLVRDGERDKGGK